MITYVLAGDYPMGVTLDYGNHNTYVGYWYSLRTSAIEPDTFRFIGKSYDTDIKHIIVPPWWWYERGYSWLGVTDYCFPLPYIEIVSEDDDSPGNAHHDTEYTWSAGNHITYNLPYAAIYQGALEPVAYRFIGKSYDNNIKYIHPSWPSGDWYGVTDKRSSFIIYRNRI